MKDEMPYWVQYNGVNIPQNALVGGQYKGTKIFIGRARHEGSLTPGVILENEKVLIIPWGCVSNRKEEFEILVGECDANWVVAKDGNAPLNAFVGGHSEQGETLFIGRYFHDNSLVVGKIQPTHHVCYIPYDDAELNNTQYEILVI